MEKKITDLLDCIQDDSVQIRAKDVASLERIKELAMEKANNSNPANTITQRRTRKLSTILIAAALAVSLLTGAAFATNFLGLRALIVPEPDASTPLPDVTSRVEENAPSQIEENVPNVPRVMQRISLQGYADSTESKAFAEWLEFRENYDADHKILNEIGNGDTGLKLTHLMYGAYTQEMADKLDEIAAKYGLHLHTDSSAHDAEELMEVVAGRSFIGDGVTPISGYVYEDGTFKLEGVVVGEDDISEDFRETLTDDAVLVIYNEDTDGFTILYVNEPPDNLDEILAPNTHTGPVIVMHVDEYDEDFSVMRTGLTGFQLVYCKKALSRISLSAYAILTIIKSGSTRRPAA